MNGRRPVGLVGDFGVDNYGNEATLAALLEAFDARGVRDVVVVADTPARVRAVHGVRSVPLEPGAPLAGPAGRVLGKARDVAYLLRLARRSGALVVPGTGILEGLWIEAGGLPLSLFVLAAGSRLMRRRFDVVAIGVDLAGSWLTRRLFGATLRLATSVSVRDERSADAAVTLGLRRKPQVVPDLVFGLGSAEATSSPEGEGDARVVVGIMDYSGRAVAPSDAARARYLDRVTELVVRLLDRGFAVHLVPGAAPDLAPMAQVAGLVERRSPGAAVTVSGARSYAEVVAEMSGARAVVASRYHTVVAALAAGVPVVAFGYGPKQDALVTSFGLPGGADIQSFEPADLVARVDDLVARRAELVARITAEVEQARSLLSAEHDRVVDALRAGPRRRASVEVSV